MSATTRPKKSQRQTASDADADEDEAAPPPFLEAAELSARPARDHPDRGQMVAVVVEGLRRPAVAHPLHVRVEIFRPDAGRRTLEVGPQRQRLLEAAEPVGNPLLQPRAVGRVDIEVGERSHTDLRRTVLPVPDDRLGGPRTPLRQAVAVRVVRHRDGARLRRRMRTNRALVVYCIINSTVFDVV